MRSSQKTKKSKSIVRTFAIAIGIVGIIVAFYFGLRLYGEVYKNNVSLDSKNSVYIYIKTGSNFDDVMLLLEDSGYLKDFDSFKRYANSRNYYKKIRPGRYKLVDGMSNHKIMNMLQSGTQEPVKVYINNIRTKEKLAAVLSRQLEPDSLKIILLLNSDSVAQSLNLTPETIISIFIPNTYEFYWNVSADDVVKRMKTEYDSFWEKKNRQQKADSLGLSREEIITIASIVDEETNYSPEMATIAGVYLNRVKRGMPLQADPTVKFAIGDPSIRRILNRHLTFDSPYNTYKYKGLPPGPIAIPSIEAIDAVLNYEKTPYIYFCAKSDFSGAHTFAITQNEHLKNAREYQAALNKRNIKK